MHAVPQRSLLIRRFATVFCVGLELDGRDVGKFYYGRVMRTTFIRD